MATGDRTEARARDVLAVPPRPPLDVSRFTSNPLFGQPGIYPDGPPMEPATDAPMSPPRIQSELHRLLGACATSPSESFDDATLANAFPDPALRAAASLLQGTVAAPALEAQLEAGTLPRYDYGAPASPGRIIGLPDGSAADASTRVVNERYRGEHFALVTPSLAHDLLYDPEGAGIHEEAFLHALLAMVHLQLLAAAPDLGDLRTELARRQHSLAITLLNSRRPGDDRIRLIAPDGPGTIPGGDPRLQSPDFWSIPFGGSAPETPAPAMLRAVLDRLAAPEDASAAPVVFGDELARWVDDHHGRGWLPVRAQLRASVALGLIDVDPAIGRWAGFAEH
jgi:hypothetical protein